MVLRILGVETEIKIPPPLIAEFPLMVTLVKTGDEPLFAIPPPETLAVFPLIITLVKTGEL